MTERPTGPANVVGAPVRGPDFWGRRADADALWRQLEHGSVLLTGPRRHGKSSLMHALADAPRPDWTVEYFDVEYVQTPSELLIELTAAVLAHQRLRAALGTIANVPGRLAGWIGGLVGEVGIGELKISLRERLGDGARWPELTEQLLAVLDRADGNVLLIVDEFPMMVGNFLERDEPGAIQFLKWFRAIRQRRGGGRLRFLLGGSVNIEPRLERIGQQALVADLERFALRPFVRDDAERFVTAILEAEDARYEEGVPRKIVEIAATGVPFFLQVLVSEVLAEARRQHRGAIVPDVADVYHARVLGPANRARFSHYHSRLKEHYGALEEPARLVLDELVLDQPRTCDALATALAHGSESAAVLPAVLALLESDYYVECDGDRVQFSSGFLRAWWTRHAARSRGRS